ncbi:MAG: VWA domain-containing protein [Pyrinomonadaceae bacterium]
MKSKVSLRRLSAVTFILALCVAIIGAVPSAFAQSRRQPPTTNQKKNKRPDPNQSGDEQQQEEPLPPDIINKPKEAETVKVTTALVNVDAVVYQKKGGQIITGLKKGNFAVFEDGVQKEITNFSTPEAPITVTLVLEYSKLSQAFGYYGSSGMEQGQEEVIRPAAAFLTGFVKPPYDFVSVVAYDMRPTPLTDFTNDPSRINQVIMLLLRNQPAFRESNLFDAIKFVLVGGKGDAVVLEDSKESQAEYAGLASVQGRRTAMLLICSGIDTFSKLNYSEARKVAQNAGVPIYIIGTGNLFLKKYEPQMEATDSLSGFPGRMTFYQADNTLRTFAKETGGMYFPVTFPGEIPKVLQSINGLLRSQYSLGYNPGDVRDGKQHKIVVKVDVNGDGQYDEKDFVVQARQFYNAPKNSDK